MNPDLAPMDPGAPMRVVDVEIPNHVLSEELFGAGIHVPRCQVVFRHMLPAPSEAALQHVTAHGLVLIFQAPDAEGAPSSNGLLVPWSQVSYVRLYHA